MAQSGKRPIDYLSVADVIGIYDVAMRESGHQPEALIREDALASAVHHPRTLGYYEGADLIEQAVDLLARIALAHAWVDGNKRVAARSFEVFLALNGVRIPSVEEYLHAADALIAYVAASGDERETIARTLIDRVRRWPS
jgi:death on curing protein